MNAPHMAGTFASKFLEYVFLPAGSQLAEKDLLARTLL